MPRCADPSLRSGWHPGGRPASDCHPERSRHEPGLALAHENSERGWLEAPPAAIFKTEKDLRNEASRAPTRRLIVTPPHAVLEGGLTGQRARAIVRTSGTRPPGRRVAPLARAGRHAGAGRPPGRKTSGFTVRGSRATGAATHSPRRRGPIAAMPMASRGRRHPAFCPPCRAPRPWDTTGETATAGR